MNPHVSSGSKNKTPKQLEIKQKEDKNAKDENVRHLAFGYL